MKNQFSQLVSILLLFLIIMGAVLFVLPLRDKIESLTVTKDALSAELQGLQSQYEELSALSEEVATSETTRSSLKAAVPSGYSEDTLLLELHQMAQASGFTLNAVNVADTVDTELGTMLTVTANFNGTYDELVTFLQSIETSERLMQVTSLALQRTSSTNITFNLNIEAYYQ